MNLYKELLYDHQKEAVDKALAHGGSFALWMQPGTGKTYTSLSIAQEKKKKKVLIICKSSKTIDWSEDAQKADYKTLILKRGKARDDKMIKAFENGAIVSSYQTAWRRDAILDRLENEKGEWIVLIDESQNFKSHKSKISKWGHQIAKTENDIILLSGTPGRRNIDFYSQLCLLGMSSDKKAYSAFLDKFCIWEEQTFPGARWSTKVITGDKNRDLLLKELMPKLSYSLKTEDAITLPKQNFITLRLDHNNAKLYKQVIEKKADQGGRVYVNPEDEFDIIALDTPGKRYLRSRELASGFIRDFKNLASHKEEALQDLLEESDNNFVIFYSFVNELEQIKRVCQDMKIAVFEQNGSTKNDYLAKQHKGRFVIASQYQSGNDGMNWQYVNHMLYYSPTPSYLQYKQSLARIHRIGQEKPVFYYHFRTINTVEVKMYNSLEQGKDYDETIFAKDYL